MGGWVSSRLPVVQCVEVPIFIWIWKHLNISAGRNGDVQRKISSLRHIQVDKTPCSANLVCVPDLALPTDNSESDLVTKEALLS